MIKRCVIGVSIAALLSTLPATAEPLHVTFGVLRQPHSSETLSILDLPAEDDTLAGALIGVADDNTTGRFTGQSYEAVDAKLASGEDPVAAAQKLVDDGAVAIVVDLPAADLLRVADALKSRETLLFNVSATDDSLREEDCRANVVHVAPTRSMLTDGLAQYLVWKQWRRWLLVKGSHPEDELLAKAYRASAKKFGAKIVDERIYVDTEGGRRSDSGSVQTQRLIPPLTQGASYDVLIAADESDVFGNYLPYRTFDPRPVAGSAGLVPTSWDASHEQWGAVQLQNRFRKQFHRGMNARDHQAWVAARMIGEAATRASSADPKTLAAYLTGPDFTIAAFKGVRLSLRPWNRQLRQPILLGDGRMIVSVSPQEGFLHQTSELDTLGVDKPETKCRLQ